MAFVPLACVDSPVGGIGRIRNAAVIVAPYVRTSMPYAHCTPEMATTTPPTAGPTTIVAFHMTWFRASAVGTCSRGTRRGVMAARVGDAMPDTPAVRPAPR